MINLFTLALPSKASLLILLFSFVLVLSYLALLYNTPAFYKHPSFRFGLRCQSAPSLNLSPVLAFARPRGSTP